MKKMIKKTMHMVIAAAMIFSFMGMGNTTASAKSMYRIDTVYNTSNTIQGKAKKNIKVTVQIGNKRYSQKTSKKGNYKIKVSKNKLRNRIGKTITVKFYQKKKNKKSWKKVKTKKTYVIADKVKLNQITDNTQSIQGYTRPGYTVKLDMDGIVYSKKASAKKGSFKIDTGKKVKQYDYTLKIYKANGSLFKSYEHKAGETKTESVFESAKKPELKKTAVKKTYTYKEYDGSTYKEKKLDAYSLTWTAINGADGYDLFVYYPAEGIWDKIKSVTTNSYKMTNLYVTKYKFKVRAYKVVSGKKVYGADSNTITIEPDSVLWEGNAEDDSKYKEQSFTQRVYDENMFVYQNKIREKAGENKIKWSNVCYEMAKIRSVTAFNEYMNGGWPHSGMIQDRNIVLNKYGADEKYINKIRDYFLENWTSVVGKEAINTWKSSEGHYESLINRLNVEGAIYSNYSLKSNNDSGIGSTIGIYCQHRGIDDEVYNGKTSNVKFEDLTEDIYE